MTCRSVDPKTTVGTVNPIWAQAEPTIVSAVTYAPKRKIQPVSHGTNNPTLALVNVTDVVALIVFAVLNGYTV